MSPPPDAGHADPSDSELLARHVDGDPTTSWQTASYLQDFGPTGLKDGVGLVLDLGTAMGVREIDIATLGGPTEVAVYVTTAAPTGVAGLTPVGTAAGVGGLTISLDEAVSGQFVTVWLTSIPPVEDEFRGTIADVVVKG